MNSIARSAGWNRSLGSRPTGPLRRSAATPRQPPLDDVILNLGRRSREVEFIVANEIALDGGFMTPAGERMIDAFDNARLIVIDAESSAQRRTARGLGAARAGWQDFLDRAAGPARHGCPPWMQEKARAAITGLPPRMAAREPSKAL
jgi:hypothetical protein